MADHVGLAVDADVLGERELGRDIEAHRPRDDRAKPGRQDVAPDEEEQQGDGEYRGNHVFHANLERREPLALDETVREAAGQDGPQQQRAKNVEEQGGDPTRSVRREMSTAASMTRHS